MRGCWPTSRPTTTRCASGTRPRTTAPCASRSRSARGRRRLAGLPPAALACCCSRTTTSRRHRPPGSPQHVRYSGTRPGRAAHVHRLAAVLQRLGDEGRVPRDPPGPELRRAARKLYDDAQRMLDRMVEREVAPRQRRRRALPGQLRGRRRRGLPRRGARARPRVLHTCASRADRAAYPTGAWPTTSLPGDRVPDHVGASRSPQGSAPSERIAEFKRGARRLQRDHDRGAGRPSGRGVRGAAARAGPQASSGATRPRRPCQTRT